MAFPVSVTGRNTGTISWLPPPMDCEPLVVLPPAEPTGWVVVPEDWPPETVLFEPSALIALPVTEMGV